jgi:hypothetical protein
MSQMMPHPQDKLLPTDFQVRAPDRDDLLDADDDVRPGCDHTHAHGNTPL